MADDYFLIKTRFKAAKASMRGTADVRPGMLPQQNVSHFLRDLVNELARMHPADPAAGQRNVLRCLADVFRPELTAILRIEQAMAPPPCDFTIWPKNRFPVKEAGLNTADWREKSALKLLGYTVGVTNGWSVEDRHDFLRYFIEAHLPLRVAELFGNEYGQPLSERRVIKIVSLLKSNISNATRHDAERYASAIDDWRTDLAYLRQIYGTAFPGLSRVWPYPGS